ncbi:hypothetical protein [Rhodococcus sp. NPDC003348]
MLARKVFFSFTHVTERASHAEYNAWHQLDHRPENLALDGVVHGERWVHSPDCAASTRTCDALDGLHYVNSYWFRAPVDESFAEWQELAVRTFQLGRRPDIRISRRLAMGTFMPVKGYVSPRCLLGADALPMRPNRGIALVAIRVLDPSSIASEQYFARQDREVIPALLDCEGVAGAWTFSSESTTLDLGRDADDGVTFAEDNHGASGQVRILMVFLDGDPARYRADRARRGIELEPAPSEEGFTLLFSGVLRNIEPWNWTWFD